MIYKDIGTSFLVQRDNVEKLRKTAVFHGYMANTYSTYRKSLGAREYLMQKRCFCSPLSATFLIQMF